MQFYVTYGLKSQISLKVKLVQYFFSERIKHAFNKLEFKPILFKIIGMAYKKSYAENVHKLVELV